VVYLEGTEEAQELPSRIVHSGSHQVVYRAGLLPAEGALLACRAAVEGASEVPSSTRCAGVAKRVVGARQVRRVRPSPQAGGSGWLLSSTRPIQRKEAHEKLARNLHRAAAAARANYVFTTSQQPARRSPAHRPLPA
jgi:hypothetical protein